MLVGIAGPSGTTQNYAAALGALHIPFEISLHPDSISRWDALLLPGGGDIDPSLYESPNFGSRHPDTALDKKQLVLLDAAIRAKKPVLGICKGMQLIQIYFGGSLVQHLATASRHQGIFCQNTAAKTHMPENTDQVHFTYAPGISILSQLYGHRFPVNSSHHQGILTPAPGLTAIQYAADGVIEALQHPSLPILGLQWHPERMCFSHSRPDTVDGSRLLQLFLEGDSY